MAKARTKADLEAELARIKETNKARVSRWRQKNGDRDAANRQLLRTAQRTMKERYAEEYADIVERERAVDPRPSTLYNRASAALSRAHRDEYDELVAELRAAQ